MEKIDTRKKNPKWERKIFFLAPFYCLLFTCYLQSVSAAESISKKSQIPAESSNFVCSDAELEPLVNRLIVDLPSYANRVIQRSRSVGVTEGLSYVIIAGIPEYEPLPLGPGRSPKSASSDIGEPVEQSSDEPRQVFITTLERNYATGTLVELQHYHWVFLTKTQSGWRLAMMFSRLGAYPAGNPRLPPRDSSNGVIAQAINTWLRDCRADVIR